MRLSTTHLPLRAAATTAALQALRMSADGDDDALALAGGTAAEVTADGMPRIGLLLAVASVASIAAFVVVLTSLLGWDVVGSADNGGIGTPLSVEEVRALQQPRDNRDDVDNRALTAEEAAEEQAIMRVIMGAPIRAK